MAGQGPAPKAAGQTRRRNAGQDFDTLPAEGYSGAYPELPATYRSLAPATKKGAPPRAVRLRFLDETRRWYETWATSPMATRFTAPTWERLLRLARLVDQFERYPDPKLLGEIRLQEASLGGTPADLLRLRMTIGAPASSKPAAPVLSIAGRRERRAVDPAGD